MVLRPGPGANSRNHICRNRMLQISLITGVFRLSQPRERFVFDLIVPICSPKAATNSCYSFQIIALVVVVHRCVSCGLRSLGVQYLLCYWDRLLALQLAFSCEHLCVWFDLSSLFREDA